MAALEQGTVFRLDTPYARALARLPQPRQGKDGRRLGNERPNADAPLPLGYVTAIAKACEWRAKGLSWPALALVMEEYHGWTRTAAWWRDKCQAAGAPAAPRGVQLRGGSEPKFPELHDPAWLRANRHRSSAEIAEELGCLASTVSARYRRAGMPRPGRGA